MFRSIFLFIAIVSSFARAMPPPIHRYWEDCGGSTDPLKIKDVDVSPFPPVVGATITATVEASLSLFLLLSSHLFLLSHST